MEIEEIVSGSTMGTPTRSVTIVDMFIAVAVLLVTLLAVGILQTRTYTRASQKARQWEAAQQLPLGEFSAGFASMVLARREKQPRMEHGSAAENEKTVPALFGWDATLPHKPGAPWKHFKTTVSRTAEMLERCAVAKGQKYARPRWMPLREYAEMVMPAKSAKRFADLYEEARFGPEEFSAAKAADMVKEMAEILQKEFPKEVRSLMGRK